jgi:tRNA1(Val) A37 N6-methylase TrmN6
VTEPAVTEDALLGGRVRLRQPAQGYRAAIDPVLLAASLADGFRGRIADLGCGVGAAALCAAVRLAAATIVGIERDPALAELARQNVAANALTGRVTVLTADIRDAGSQDAFDAVLANPPYLEAARANAQPDARKAAATIEDDAALDVWVDAALARLRPKGMLAMIHRADRLDDLLAALRGRAGEAVVFPLWPKAGVAAKRVIVRARKGVRSPLVLSAGLVLHEMDGRYTPAAERILRDGAALNP